MALNYVKVVGRFGLTVGDTEADPDHDPDTIWCDEGEVWFTPMLPYTKVPGASPMPATLGHSVIRAQIDSEGYLTYLDQRSVHLVDLTDPTLNPHISDGRATHRVEFRNVRAGDLPVSFAAFNTRLAPDMAQGGVLDLTLVSPVPTGGGTPIIQGPPGPPGPSTPAGVSFDGLTLSSAAPAVTELANVNEWTVTDAVQVQLPAVAAGSQHTVHVTSGFQNITWPNGTTVYGETDLQDVWVTLIRGDASWNVLIPSPPLAGGSGAGLDTGWVTHVGGIPGFGIVAGDAADLHTGWGLGTEMLTIQLRRTGNVLHISVSGLQKIGPSSVGLFKLPAGITVGTNLAASAQIPYHLAGSGYPLPSGLLSVAVTGVGDVSGYTLDPDNPLLPEGATIGRTSGSSRYGSMFSFPIDPTSVWGT